MTNKLVTKYHPIGQKKFEGCHERRPQVPDRDVQGRQQGQA